MIIKALSDLPSFLNILTFSLMYKALHNVQTSIERYLQTSANGAKFLLQALEHTQIILKTS